MRKLLPLLSAIFLVAFAIVLVNCGNDSHPNVITASNQFALIREAPAPSASVAAAQRHLPMSLRHLSRAERHMQRAHKLHQGTGLKPLAVEIGSGTDSVVIMNNDGTGETIVYNQGGWFYSVHMGVDGEHGVATAEDINGDIQVYYADITDKNNPVLTQLTTEAVDHWSAQLSWDNKSVVYMKYVSEGDKDQAAIMSTSGGAEKILTTTFDVDLPTFTPDGKIVFGNDESERIYMMNADGSNIHQLITPGEGEEDYCPSVSPDGKTITFDRWVPQQPDDIWIANIDGSNAKRLTTSGDNTDPMFVNNKIVYLHWTPSTDVLDIYSMDANGQNQRALTSASTQQYFDYWWFYWWW